MSLRLPVMLCVGHAALRGGRHVLDEFVQRPGGCLGVSCSKQFHRHSQQQSKQPHERNKVKCIIKRK
eukprot:scaffold332243_cov16-Prasinocladus_malaysianus.AAC.1